MSEKTFSEMTDAEKRVTLAKDALKWIDAGVLVPTSGTYLYMDDEPENLWDLQPLVQGSRVKCEVCARGALFVSHVCEGQIPNEGQYPDNYAGPFGLAMEDIERAFEHPTNYPLTQGFPKILDGDSSDLNQEPRLRAILANIIANDGTFMPGQESVEVPA